MTTHFMGRSTGGRSGVATEPLSRGPIRQGLNLAAETSGALPN